MPPASLPPEAPKIPAPVLRLINAVCERHGLTAPDIFADYTDRDVTDCRGEIVWRLRHGHANGVAKPYGIQLMSKWFGRSRTTLMACMSRHARLRVLAQRGSFS